MNLNNNIRSFKERFEPNRNLCSTDTDPDVQHWPRLKNLIMPPEQQATRITAIGGSDANTILSGNLERIVRLWREKRGEVNPEDLSTRLPVMLGCWSEAFNRQWYEQESGLLVSAVGSISTCPQHAWRRCALDGFIAAKDAVFEAKHVSAFAKPEEILDRYMPQIQHNMAVTGSDRAVLSVIFGNHKWEIFEVGSDWLYQEELLIAETRFWDCVRTGELPIAAPVPSTPKAIGVREVCFEGNNTWAAAAADWLENRNATKRHGIAAALLKGLVPDDASRAFGHSLEIRRSKVGALSIREMRL
jgi:hypothetical protein